MPNYQEPLLPALLPQNLSDVRGSHLYTLGKLVHAMAAHRHQHGLLSKSDRNQVTRKMGMVYNQYTLLFQDSIPLL